jgi:hypothetical protein
MRRRTGFVYSGKVTQVVGPVSDGYRRMRESLQAPSCEVRELTIPLRRPLLKSAPGFRSREATSRPASNAPTKGEQRRLSPGPFAYYRPRAWDVTSFPRTFLLLDSREPSGTNLLMSAWRASSESSLFGLFRTLLRQWSLSFTF